MLRELIQDLAAERLGLRIAALAKGAFAAAMMASACFLNFFCNRAFWNARAPALLCKVALRRMANEESNRFACPAGRLAPPPGCPGDQRRIWLRNSFVRAC
ncbi:hypothetical protein ACVWYH_009190 [Bradyrhizobium sp. GM24.11]